MGLVLAATDPVSAAVRAVLRFHQRAVARWNAGARAGEVQAIHQLRVATRRLRAALRLFGPMLPVAAAGAARADLAWLGRAIGDVRDLDVLALAVASQGRRIAPELREALGPLERSIRERRAVAHAALVIALDSARGRGMEERLKPLLHGEVPRRRERALGEIAGGLIKPLGHAVLRAAAHVGPDAAPETLHRLRVRIKRLRYALETLQGLGGAGTAKTLARLERLQEVLGEHQDAVTQIAWLQRWAETETAPPATLLATGALVHRLARRARRRRRRFARTWKRFDRTRLGRLLDSRRAPRARRLRLVARGS